METGIQLSPNEGRLFLLVSLLADTPLDSRLRGNDEDELEN